MIAHASRAEPGGPPPISIDQVLGILPATPRLTTRERGWAGVTVDVYQQIPDCSVSYAGFDHHVICYCPSGRARLVQGRDGKLHESTISTGLSLVMPAGYDSLWEGDVAASSRMRIPTELVEMAGEQLGPRRARVEIVNVFETRDPMIERIALTLTAELEMAAHPAQALIVDAMSSALAAHMVRSYNAFEPVERRRLPPFDQMQLARLSDYIEDNLDRLIGLAELAAIVNVSRFHFARQFKQSTGITPIAYVEQCRIRRAQSLIADTDAPLAQIALMTGFADQSHFTRRFHRHVGCTPATYARNRGRRRSTVRSDG